MPVNGDRLFVHAEGTLLLDVVTLEEQRCEDLICQCENLSAQQIMELLEPEIGFIDSVYNVECKCRLYLKLVEAYRDYPAPQHQAVINLLEKRLKFIYQLPQELGYRSLFCIYLAEAFNAQGFSYNAQGLFVYAKGQFNKAVQCINYEKTLRPPPQKKVKFMESKGWNFNQLKVMRYIQLGVAYNNVHPPQYKDTVECLEPLATAFKKQGFSGDIGWYQLKLCLLLAETYNSLGHYKSTIALLGDIGGIHPLQNGDMESKRIELLNYALSKTHKKTHVK